MNVRAYQFPVEKYARIDGKAPPVHVVSTDESLNEQKDAHRSEVTSGDLRGPDVDILRTSDALWNFIIEAKDVEYRQMQLCCNRQPTGSLKQVR